MKLAFREVVRCIVLTLAFCAPAMAAAESDDWWHRAPVFPSRYYIVKTDLPKDEAVALARHMDLTCEAYAALFAGFKNWRPKRLELYLFASRDDYIPTLLKQFNARGEGSWGMAIPRGTSMSLAAWRGKHEIDEMKSLLQHEGFHQFAKQLFPKLPTWANEGMAGIFERGVVAGNTLVLGAVKIGDWMRIKKALHNRTVMPFDQFFTMRRSEWNHQVREGDAHGNYLQAWSVTHFFLYANDGRYQTPFLKFLSQLNNDSPWKDAFVAAFGTPDFRAIWKRSNSSLTPKRTVFGNDCPRKMQMFFEFLCPAIIRIENSSFNWSKNFPMRRNARGPVGRARPFEGENEPTIALRP